MKKFLFVMAATLSASSFIHAQSLFTYGNKQVSKQEFLAAFNKNPTPGEERKKALDEYLNLYVNYKLKVQAAYDEKLNTQQSFVLESNNFKRQIAENIVNEEAGVKTLVQQAFLRSQKDIHAAHVFIELPQGADTVKAYQQIQQAYKELQQGKDFSEIVAFFSNGDDTKKTKGDLGYITAFTLQYPIESEIYALKEGAFSKPYRSVYGYHIFKNSSERPASGKRKIAQILIAFPQDAAAAEKETYRKKADSIYNLVTHSEPFEKAAAQFSNDARSAANGGVLNEVSIGQYDAGYEAKIFGLKTIGEISKPIETNYGYHIIKLLEIIPVNKDSTDATALAFLKQQVERDNRLTVAKKNLAQKWMQQTQFKKAVYNTNELWAFTDSAVIGAGTKNFKAIKDSTVLFSFAKEKVYVVDWVNYTRAAKAQGRTGNDAIMKDFIIARITDYYTTHLEDYNTTMQQQAKEFNEANLLFAAMDKHVWARASEDINGLKKYFEQHTNKYQWQPGVSALVITSTSKLTADEVAAKLKQSPADWRNIASGYGANVIADSSRYEQQQLPVKLNEQRVGFISAPEKNINEESYTFVYITAVHPTPEQRGFDDARGMIISDYQQVLEQEWLAALKKKYPVKVNDAVWKTVK